MELSGQAFLVADLAREVDNGVDMADHGKPSPSVDSGAVWQLVEICAFFYLRFKSNRKTVLSTYRRLTVLKRFDNVEYDSNPLCLMKCNNTTAHSQYRTGQCTCGYATLKPCGH